MAATCTPPAAGFPFVTTPPRPQQGRLRGMPAAVDFSLVSCVAALVAAAAACLGAFLARGSTAVPAAAWACAAALALAAESAGRATGGLTEPAAFAAARLGVVALSMCPTMSVLGAKRPQHGVWQFIVASLAGILALPAVSALLVRPGSMPDVHPLQQWFMPLLAAVGWMNFAATRHGLAAAIVTSGQLLLLRPFLPFAGELDLGRIATTDAVGAALLAVGSVAAVVQSAVWPVGGRRASHERVNDARLVAAVERPFLALRETLGAAWTLRIAERFNATAAARGWPCRLRFGGLDVGGDAGGRPWQADAIRTARALVRRFASDDWLRRHGGEAKNP